MTNVKIQMSNERKMNGPVNEIMNYLKNIYKEKILQ